MLKLDDDIYKWSSQLVASYVNILVIDVLFFCYCSNIWVFGAALPLFVASVASGVIFRSEPAGADVR